MPSGDLVVAGRVHLAPAEPDEVRVPAAEPDEVGVDAAADGGRRVPAFGGRGRRPTVERPPEPYKVLFVRAAPGQRVRRLDAQPVDPVRGHGGQRQRQRHRQQVQQHCVTCKNAAKM